MLLDDDVLQVRRELADQVDHRVPEGLLLVVPVLRALGQVVGRVLDEAAHDVLARRRHGRVHEAGEDDVNVGPAAEAAVLRLVVGALHVLQRGADAHRAAEVLGAARVRREGRQRVEGEVDLAGASPELEAAHLRLEVPGQDPGLQELEERAPNVR
jgi:hypothetical protein